MDLTLRTIKQCARLEDLQHRANCPPTGALTGVAIEDSEQEKIERTGTQRIVFPVLINLNRRPAVLLGIVEELDPGMQRESDEPGRVRCPFAATNPRRLAQHVLDHLSLLIFDQDRTPPIPRWEI